MHQVKQQHTAALAPRSSSRRFSAERSQWITYDRILATASIAVALVLSACGSADDRPAPLTGTTPQGDALCEDKDGDTFGYGCSSGLDCNDEDPNLTRECLCQTLNTPGCACAAAGAQMACGTVQSKVGQNIVCGEGITTCDGETWGECIINNAVTLKSMPLASTRTLALGAPSGCATNPCDPGCKTFNDTPEGVDVSGGQGVVTSTAGVTLPSGQTVVVPGVSSSGFACNNSNYPANGGCAHHPCRTGTSLAKWCDGAAPTEVALGIFSEDFSSSNAAGWVLGSNWAMGAATSSSGHTTGNADPATDATSGTSDNRIAGTVIGGNIGGGVTLLSETFGDLATRWTETGDGDWTTQSRESSSGYASGSSGSPVAHSDDCDGSCTITLTNGLNLSSYSSATLSFQYYLNNGMDNGEFLRGEASTNGTTWTQVFNKTADAGDDDSTWHAVSISLASYLVNSFKFRFVTKESGTDESVEVDDLNVTVPAASATSYLTSPTFNTSASYGNVTLSFKRWLNVNAELVAKVEIYNGSSWVALYTSSGAVSDNAWQNISYDITPYKSASTKVRFSYTGTSTSKVSGWNVDDVVVGGTQLTSGSSLCVNKVCAAKPACCTTAWTLDCVQALASVCQVECAVDPTNNDACTTCFKDPTLTVDVDGDGLSPATGDCRECDPGINAGAYDVPGNAIDENCDNVADNEPSTCDSGLAASGNAMAHANAIGLCKAQSGSSWGVVSAAFVRADGVTPCTDSKQYEIMSSFGSGNTPVQGSKMSAFSSGTARSSSETGYVKPDGTGYNANTAATPKYPVPAAAGCNSGTAGYDSCGLKLVIKAPTNAHSFGYNFNFFTSEYPEWLCTSYNDAYVAYYEGSLNTNANKNISYDSVNNPVSVNNGLFSIPGIWPPPSTGTNTLLNGTGFDGVCSNSSGGTWILPSICGGSTGWLQTNAPVKAGEQITLIFNVWDTGDHKWDSTVLLDRFNWSTKTATVTTGHYTPGTPDTVIPSTFEAGWFTRDYDMTGVCDYGFRPLWSLWSWGAETPSDSKIEFYVQAASTAAGLSSAVKDPLLFSAVGPTALVGQPTLAKSGTPDTRTGSAMVNDTLAKYKRTVDALHVRISAHLLPSTDLLSAPSLTSWNLQTSCQAVQ